MASTHVATYVGTNLGMNTCMYVDYTTDCNCLNLATPNYATYRVAFSDSSLDVFAHGKGRAAVFQVLKIEIGLVNSLYRR